MPSRPCNQRAHKTGLRPSPPGLRHLPYVAPRSVPTRVAQYSHPLTRPRLTARDRCECSLGRFVRFEYLNSDEYKQKSQ